MSGPWTATKQANKRPLCPGPSLHVSVSNYTLEFSCQKNSNDLRHDWTWDGIKLHVLPNTRVKQAVLSVKSKNLGRAHVSAQNQQGSSATCSSCWWALIRWFKTVADARHRPACFDVRHPSSWPLRMITRGKKQVRWFDWKIKRRAFPPSDDLLIRVWGQVAGWQCGSARGCHGSRHVRCVDVVALVSVVAAVWLCRLEDSGEGK